MSCRVYENITDTGEIEKIEVIDTQADQFSGVVRWAKYNFLTNTLEIIYRLSDIITTYYDIPVNEYEKFTEMIFKSYNEEKKYIEYFKTRYIGFEL